MIPARLQNPPQPPPLFTHTPDAILSNARKLADLTKSVEDAIVANVSVPDANFDNVLKPMLLQENEDSIVNRVITFYQHVSPNDSLRQASTEAEELLEEVNIESTMREDIFQRVNAAYEQRASHGLDSQDNHLLEKRRQSYIRNGLLLPEGPKRDRFKEIQKRLSQLCIQGQKNLNEEKGGIWFTPTELDGVPKSDIDIDTLEKGTGENEGKVRLTFKYTHSLPLMEYAKNEETRKRYNLADCNKANNNVPIFSEILALRDEAARLLGYADHASLRIEPKMAKTTSRVNEFLGDLRKRLVEGGEIEQKKRVEYKKRDYAERKLPFDGEVYSWDTSYYSRLIKVAEYSVDENAIAEYFPVEPTFNAMIKIFEEIFGLEFAQLQKEDRAKLSPNGNADDLVWHKDVLVYSVWDDEASGGAFNGYLYLDLHPRDNKYSHNANFNLEPGFIAKDGSRHYPATALVCNFSPPSATKPGLLKHREVITLFHELGHAIHDLVGRTRYAATHGTSVVPDFVEAPSQMLENWCWTPSVLKRLSQHWDSGEPIADDLLEKLVSTKKFNSATGALNQLVIGTFDMAIHTPKTHEEAEKINAGKIWNELRFEISGVKGFESTGLGMEWGNRYASIGHFIGGYDAGYYGYLFSEVFSADMFYSFFEENPMNGTEGRRYRHTVLERGGSVDEMGYLTEYLGREPSTEAFYKSLGLE